VTKNLLLDFRARAAAADSITRGRTARNGSSGRHYARQGRASAPGFKGRMTGAAQVPVLADLVIFGRGHGPLLYFRGSHLVASYLSSRSTRSAELDRIQATVVRGTAKEAIDVAHYPPLEVGMQDQTRVCPPLAGSR